jgi:hypothetical protein
MVRPPKQVLSDRIKVPFFRGQPPAMSHAVRQPDDPAAKQTAASDAALGARRCQLRNGLELASAQSAPARLRHDRRGSLSKFREIDPQSARAPATRSRGRQGSTLVCHRSRRVHLGDDSRRGRTRTRLRREPGAVGRSRLVPSVCLSSSLSAIRAERRWQLATRADRFGCGAATKSRRRTCEL